MTEGSVARYPLPHAYVDPAIIGCLSAALGNDEMLSNFDRLRGTSLVRPLPPLSQLIDEATGKRDDDVRAFVDFVHDAIYMRMPDLVIAEMRDAHAQSAAGRGDAE